ncbi:hypothetical protein F5X96DRAFT_685586 [Biscogniauxia mediterranea]|nr:hypothetical protein F5X96DRAFT_685586 [Biscogniauxia mediterranea]
MCRRIITHHMHHDVRQPMIIDACAHGDPPVYVNPLHTPFHTCEVTWPCHEHWLLNKPRSCNYHSCCLPQEKIEFCDDMKDFFLDDQDSDTFDHVEEDLAMEHEPEECQSYSLVHRHEQLPYFGIPEAFDTTSDTCYSEDGWHILTKLWRDDLKEISYGDQDWFPCFEHDAMYRTNWEILFFQEAAKLYQAECDARIQDAVMTDLTDAANAAYDRQLTFCSLHDYYENSTIAFNNLLRAEQCLGTQKQLLFDLAQWAAEPCGGCEHF